MGQNLPCVDSLAASIPPALASRTLFPEACVSPVIFLALDSVSPCILSERACGEYLPTRELTGLHADAL